MNKRSLDNKVRLDIAKVEKDISTLEGDSAMRFGRFVDDVGQATEDAKDNLTEKVEDSASRLSKEYLRVSGNVKDSLADAATTVKKEVGHRYSQIKAQTQKTAHIVPGDLSKQAGKYPWVVISIGLFVGFLLGMILKPVRQPVG